MAYSTYINDMFFTRLLWKGQERNGTEWEEALWQFIDDSSTLLSARRTHMGEQILSCRARKIGGCGGEEGDNRRRRVGGRGCDFVGGDGGGLGVNMRGKKKPCKGPGFNVSRETAGIKWNNKIHTYILR